MQSANVSIKLSCSFFSYSVNLKGHNVVSQATTYIPFNSSASAVTVMCVYI